MIDVNDFTNKQILFVFMNEGEKLSFSNDNIVVKDKEGKTKHQSTCYRLFAVFVVGHTVITSGLIEKSKKFKFSIVLMTTSLRVYDIIGSKMEGNTLLRTTQYKYNNLDIGRYILINKINNQRYALNKIRNKTDKQKQAIQKLDEYIDNLRNNNDFELTQMLGTEGSAARVYFKSMFSETEWKSRKPRIKQDYINATLDIGYTLYFNLLDALLNIYGFDTYYGVLHKSFYMRKSLVCDIIEPFRAMIDWEIRKAINLNQCKKEDFNIINGRYVLKWDKNSAYIKFLIQPFMDNKREIFLYIQGFYRAFMKQKDACDFPIFEMR